MSVKFNPSEPFYFEHPYCISNDMMGAIAMDYFAAICLRPNPNVVKHFALAHRYCHPILRLLYFEPSLLCALFKRPADLKRCSVSDTGIFRKCDIVFVVVEKAEQAPAVHLVRAAPALLVPQC